MATAIRGQDLLSSEFLTQLERLAIVSRRAFRGRMRGERKSPRKGMSVEFSDYRQYGVGDDLRYVDWNIYGRLDRLYLKLFVDEEDLCLHLLLDGSGSMSFGEPSKLRYAARLAAALGFVGLVNHERVGVAVVRDRMAEGWNPTRGRGQLLSLLDFAARLRAGGPTGLSEGLAAYALRSREAGVAVLISDLLDPVGYEAGLKALLERRFDVHVIHVLAPEEMNPILAGSPCSSGRCPCRSCSCTSSRCGGARRPCRASSSGTRRCATARPRPSSSASSAIRCSFYNCWCCSPWPWPWPAPPSL